VPEAETMIIPTVELDTSSQIYKVLQRLDKYNIKFAKQETEFQRMAKELWRMNKNLQRGDEELQKMIATQQKTTAAQQQTIAELSANVTRVSYPSSPSTSQRNLLNHPLWKTQMLNALHHHVVLDQAHDSIIDHYGFNISNL